MQGALIISHGVSQGVSHAQKIHMVFTCISHSFHRVAPSSVDSKNVGLNNMQSLDLRTRDCSIAIVFK